MRFTLFILFGLFSTASAWGGWGHLWSWPFSWNHGDWSWSQTEQPKTECRCSPTRLTLDEKLALVAEDNDYNNDGKVTYADLYCDVVNNYDTNKDGQLSERECINRVSCRYGDTEQVSQYICASILSGKASVPITSFNRDPFIGGVPLEQFLQNSRGRYKRFFNARCVNRDITVEEKLVLNAAANDYNNDGLVTAADITYDMTNNYDTDKDGLVSKAEWVVRWVCAYGDTGDFARFLWERNFQDATSVNATMAATPPFDTGVPTGSFSANLRQNYETYRNRDASNYVQFQP